MERTPTIEGRKEGKTEEVEACHGGERGEWGSHRVFFFNKAAHKCLFSDPFYDE